MSRVWRCLEELASRGAALAEWRWRCGADLPAVQRHLLSGAGRDAKAVMCSNGCGCSHRLHRRTDGNFVGVCECPPDVGCPDMEFGAEDAAAWEVNTPRLGRTVARALKFDARDTVTGTAGTRQIGSYGGAAMPIFLTVQRDADGFRGAVSELAARQREHFILLAPTTRFHDGGTKELLAAAKAGFFDLESHLTLTAQGEFRAPKLAADLFPPFLPTATEPMPEDVVRAALALVMRLDSVEGLKPPTLLTVFRLYCGEGLTMEQVRRHCRCSKGTVDNRKRLIREKTGLDLEQFRAYSNQFEKVEDEMREARAIKVSAKAMLDDTNEDSDETG